MECSENYLLNISTGEKVCMSEEEFADLKKAMMYLTQIGFAIIPKSENKK